MKKYTFQINYNYGGFATKFIKADTIEEAINELPKSYKVLSYSIFATHAL